MKRKHVISKNNGDNDEAKKTRVLDGAESLFHANIYKLQIEQLLSEVKVSGEKKNAIQKYIAQLKAVMTSMPSDKASYQMSNLSWLKRTDIMLPFDIHRGATLKGSFRFVATKNVQVIGSLAINTFNRRHGYIDIVVEMPQECIQDKDYLNERYLIKRAMYLACIANNLKKTNPADQLQYSFQHGCRAKPVLHVKPSVSSLKHLTFIIHVCLAPDTFKLGRFNITKNNVRSQWFQSGQNDSAVKCEDKATPHYNCEDKATPHYNSWMLADLTMQAQNSYLERSLGTSQNVADGLALLKVWLHQRQLDLGFGSISGFIISMFVAYLIMKGRLTAAMSSYHVFRKTLVELAQQDWNKEPITMVADESASDSGSQPSLDDFHKAFDVVFVDVTGYLNFCADVSLATYQQLKYEAQQSVSYMDTTSAFRALFMTPMAFIYRSDQTFRVCSLEVFKSKTVKHLNLNNSVIDHCGDYFNASLPSVVKLLREGLGERVKLLTIKPTASPLWNVTSPVPDVLPSKCVWFGLVVDPQLSTVSLDLGPFGGTPEAETFRMFWKEKSELRRFPDGSIREAVYWPSDTLADKRMICCRIVKHVLSSHAGIPLKNIKFLANQCDTFLHQQINLTGNDEEDTKPITSTTPTNGTGEEQQAAIIACCDDLGKQLHKAVSASDSLHLTINSVNGIAPAFRYCEVFPSLPVRDTCKLENRGFRLVPTSNNNSPSPMYTPPLPVVCLLEGSGKWPEDIEAIRRLKASYYLDLGRSLNRTSDGLQTAAYTDHLDVSKDGYVFRVTVGFHHEIVLHKKQLLPDGKLKLSDSEASAALEYQYLVLPRLTSCLHGLHLQHNSFGTAVRLAKRWLASQMLLRHYIAEEAVELLVASLYISPEPFTSPSSPMVGFIRFVHLLSKHDWQREPLIVNINNELTHADCEEIHAKFTKERSTLPIMFVSTPFDRYSQIWTKKIPTVPILQRMARLANEACTVLEQNMLYEASKSGFKQIFRTSLSHFDAVIRLHDHISAHRHCAIGARQLDAPCCTPFSSLQANKKEMWSVVGYDPVHQYIEDLKAAFEDFCLFFHDVFGGSFIGVLWKPTALQQQQFTISHANCRLPVLGAEEKELCMTLDKEAIIEDFMILGRGLVDDIGIRNSDSVFVSVANGSTFDTE